MKEQLLDEQKTHFEAIESEIEFLLDASDFEKAFERLDAILKSVPNTPQWQLFRAGLACKQAQCLLELDQDEKALELATLALDNGWSTSTSHAVLAWAHYHADDLDAAESEFQKAIALDPNNATALFGRALVNRNLGNLDQAHQDINAAMEADNDFVPAFALAVEIEIELGNRKKGSDILNAGRVRWPFEPELALIDAQFQAGSHHYRKALEALDVVFDEHNVPSEARLLEVEILIRKGDFDAAVKQAISASQLYPDDAFAYLQLAAAHLQAKNDLLALEAAERAVNLDPSLPDAYAVRAAARLTTKDYTGASRDLADIADAEMELPHFLYGTMLREVDSKLLIPSFQEILDKNRDHLSQNDVAKSHNNENLSDTDAVPPTNPFAGGNPFEGMMPNMPPGFNPMALLNQMFDSEGNIRPMFKPILKMALKNAPSLFKSMPKEMLGNRTIDPELLEKANFDSMSDEEFERSMKLFYQMLKQQL